MSNATFSRKPLVAAVLTTLAVFSTGAMAADGEQEVTLTVGTGANTVPNTIKDEKTWDEDWAKTFNKDFTNASGKVTINGQNSDKITISKDEANKTAGKLTNKLSSLTLNVGLDVAEGGTFVNNGTLEANKAITVTGSLVNTGTLKTNETLTIKGGFDNAKGKIEATKDVTINGLDKTTDLEAAPASVVMGDITLTNATLTNNDKGYKLKTEAEKKEGEADKTPENRVRVTYGKVTLNEGGNFVNIEGALDSGSNLTITKDAGTAQINGTSTWGTINAQKNDAVTVGDKGTLSVDHLVYDHVAGTSATIADRVSVATGGTFTVNKGFTVGSFAQNGKFDLSQGKNQYLASGAPSPSARLRPSSRLTTTRTPTTARSLPMATTIRAPSRSPAMRPNGRSPPRAPQKAMPTRTRRVPGMSPSSAPSRSTTTPSSRFPAAKSTTSPTMAIRLPCRSAASRLPRRPSR